MEPREHPEPETAQAPEPEVEQEPEAGDAEGPALRVGYDVGMMPGKWFRRWRERAQGDGLEELQLEPGQWARALGGDLDVAFARLVPHPQDGADPALADLDTLRRGFQVVELYEEQQVVVLPVEDTLTLHDEIPIGELADQWLLQDPAQLPEHVPAAGGAGVDAEGAVRPLPELADAGTAIELVAAGVGLVVVPMSVARWHHRKDLTYRPVTGLPLVPVVLIWPQDLPEQTETMVQDFLGIVRGRRSGTSRSSEAEPTGAAAADDLSRSGDPEVQRAVSAARRRSAPKKAAPAGTRTGKGTSRGDQLAGKRLAGGRPRRAGGGGPKGRGGRPSRGR